jgi:uncharacterized protein YdeI (YjbR/CyaY-like superfamily)
MAEAPIREFKNLKLWAAWLKNNHQTANEVWVRFFKKASSVQSVSYSEALDEALCWGWIDGHLKAGDSKSWLRRFTPRIQNSRWSKRNCEHVERLIATGRMRSQGIAQVEAAKADGRWKQAYSPPSEARVPSDFLRELKKDKIAEAFFKTLNKANLYAIVYRLETAKKPETRERRFNQILAMMKDGKKFH